MRRWTLSALALVPTAGLLFLLGHAGHAQNPGVGPGTQGGQFSNPFEAAPVARPSPLGAPTPFRNPLETTTVPVSHETSTASKKLLSQYNQLFPLLNTKAGEAGYQALPLQSSFENLALNRDIEIHDKVAPWCIYIHNYKGDKAPQRARDFVTELRTVNKLPAYVFNYGEAEMKKEFERVKKLIEDQKQMLKQQGLTTDLPIKVRYTPHELHVGILIGGWNTEAEARRALENVHKLPQPDPAKIELDRYWQSVQANQFANPQSEKKTMVSFRVGDKPAILKDDHSSAYVNPFPKAWVCRNPALPQQQVAPTQELDAKSLRSLNAGESFSLLNCPKAFTLVIKEFSTPRFVKTKDEEKSVMEMLGLNSSERVDAAGASAHNLAEVLRKVNLESYVLHTQYNSFVTVGGYDSPEDPNLKEMQDRLEKKLKIPVVSLLPRPLPFKVPR